MRASIEEAVTFLTVREFAELMKVSERTVYGWVARSAKTRVPVERAGGMLRFRLDRVLRWSEGKDPAEREAAA